MALLEGLSVVEYRERLYFFGGRDSVTGMILNTLWVLPVADVTKARGQRPEESSLLTARADRRLAIERDASGGFSPPAQRTTTTSRARRSGAVEGGVNDEEAKGMLAAADEAQRQAYAAAFTNPLPVVAPRPVHCTGHIPTPRCYHQCCLRDSFMLVVGGTTVRDISKAATSGVSDDSYLRDDLVLWALNLDTLVWNKYYLPGAHSTVPRFNGAPLPRCHATLTATPDAVLLYGGFPVDPSAPPLPNHWSLFEINEDAEARAVPCAGDSPTLWGHTASFAHGCLFVFGGVDSTSMSEVNTLCVYSFTEHRWRWADFALAPEPRALHTCAMAGSKLYVFGGFSGRPDKQHFPHLGDTWSFCLNSGLWEEVQGKGDIPPARSGHAAVVHGGVMYVCGGLEGNAADHRGVATLCALDLNTSVWTNYRLLFDDATVPAVQADVDLDLLDATAKQAPPPVWPTAKPNRVYGTADDNNNDDSPPRTANMFKARSGNQRDTSQPNAKGSPPRPPPSAAEKYILDSLAAVRSAAPASRPATFVPPPPNGGSSPARGVTITSPPGTSPFADVASLVKSVQNAEEKSNFATQDTKRDVQQWQDANARRSHLGVPIDTLRFMPFAEPSGPNAPAANKPVATDASDQKEFLARLERQRRAAFDTYSPISALSPKETVNREGGALARPGRPSAPMQQELRDFEPSPSGNAARAVEQMASPPRVDSALNWQQRGAQTPPSAGRTRHATFVPAPGFDPNETREDDHDDDGPAWATSPQPLQHSVTSVRYGDRDLTNRVNFVPVPTHQSSSTSRARDNVGFSPDEGSLRRAQLTSPVNTRLSVLDVTSSPTMYPPPPAAAHGVVQSPPHGAEGDEVLTPARAAYLRRARLNPA